MSSLTKSADKTAGQLKINVTNIRSTLLKGSKKTSTLAKIKEKSIFKKKEAEKINEEEKALEVVKPKKKITKKSSPLQGGGILDKLIEAGILILGGFFANAIPELIKALKEPFQNAMGFLKGIYDGLKEMFDFIMKGGVDKNKIETDKSTVEKELSDVMGEKNELESLASSGLSEYSAVESELDNLTVDDDGLDEGEEEGEDSEEELDVEGGEIEGREVEDGSDLGPVQEGGPESTDQPATEEEQKDAVVEGMKKDPEVQKLAEGGKSKQGAANETTNIKDSIPTLLSPGEYVLSAKIAKAIGYDVLDGINGIGPGSGTQQKFKEISMLNKGKKNGKTVIVKQTQVVQTPVPV